VEAKDIVFIIIGCVSILIGSVGKKFYRANVSERGFHSGKPMPSWLGRVLFWLFGVLFIAIGARGFFAY
jgi:hypothetical protein